jgi:hypothetical protein
MIIQVLSKRKKEFNSGREKKFEKPKNINEIERIEIGKN